VLNTNPYQVHKELRFELDNIELAIVSNDGQFLEIEETRKNGQEDCHMFGDLRFVDGMWQWGDDWSRDKFYRFGSEDLAAKIIAYLNTNPPPLLSVPAPC